MQQAVCIRHEEKQTNPAAFKTRHNKQKTLHSGDRGQLKTQNGMRRNKSLALANFVPVDAEFVEIDYVKLLQ